MKHQGSDENISNPDPLNKDGNRRNVKTIAIETAINQLQPVATPRYP